jgi:hypothetical protein
MSGDLEAFHGRSLGGPHFTEQKEQKEQKEQSSFVFRVLMCGTKGTGFYKNLFLFLTPVPPTGSSQIGHTCGSHIAADLAAIRPSDARWNAMRLALGSSEEQIPRRKE